MFGTANTCCMGSVDEAEGVKVRSLTWTALFTALFVFNGMASFAFTPNEVLVVYNNQPLPDPSSLEYATAIQIVPASEGVARYYAQARGIPASNLLGLPNASFYCEFRSNPNTDFSLIRTLISI